MFHVLIIIFKYVPQEVMIAGIKNKAITPISVFLCVF